MTSKEIRHKFQNFLEKRGHTIIPSSSVVPENDPSVLFTTAGMQPLVPYLTGEQHPAGTRLANLQKCIRTVDIEEVGDNTHHTFFEMMGYWSLGDYFKKEAIAQTFDFITSSEEGLGLDVKRLYVTCFEGNEDAPRDTDSAEIWKSLGIPENRIFFLGVKDNWWSPGDNGPCGPDSELFYDRTENGLGDISAEEFDEANESQKVVEIVNNVFMEYKKENGKVVGKLAKQNVDMGAGFERITAIVQGKQNAYDTDLFSSIISKIKSLSNKEDVLSERIIADHVRTAVIMISDGILPSNTDQGYILRRLLRRAIRRSDNLGMPASSLSSLVEEVASIYEGIYINIRAKQEFIEGVIDEEENKFRKTLSDGIKHFTKITADGNLSGEDAFKLFSTYGFPFELTKELAKEKNIQIDEEGFAKSMQEHQFSSRTASAGKFKGGLAGSGEMETKYHTATHLLNAGLRKVLGEHVGQKGSNITSERLRFDFSHNEKMTPEQISEVENFVNQKIQEKLDVVRQEMPLEDARKLNAIGLFGEKYGDIVSVYTIGDENNPTSREFCGGPHVENIENLGKFKIVKEEASSAGVRRIKATLE
ncbi:MAG: alanine--tRNA ligase [Candidatus Pacebacteria bacterium]|nr:alanine--tRNA ligase [Candidatus Paceibacterota bacterium]